MINSTSKLDPSSWTDSTEINLRVAKWGIISLVAGGIILSIGVIAASIVCFKTQASYWNQVNGCWTTRSYALLSLVPIVGGGFLVVMCFESAISLHAKQKENYSRSEDIERAKQLFLVKTPLELRYQLQISKKDSLGIAVRSLLISVEDGKKVEKMMGEYSTANSTFQRLKNGSQDLKDRSNRQGMIHFNDLIALNHAQDTLERLQPEWDKMQEKWKKKWTMSSCAISSSDKKTPLFQ